MQHIYAVTTPLSELTGAAEEISMPFVRHQDKSMYFRQVGESVGIGSYLHRPLLVESDDIPGQGEAPIAPAEMPFTPEHFESAMEAAREVMPGLEGAGLTRRFNGLFSFTNDGFPVLGESPQVRGFWSAQAVWISHAGGVGRAVAEWIVNGEPATDIRECHIRRFHPHALSRPYVRARSAQQYREVYDIIHPRQQMANPRNVRLTPFFARQEELGAAFFENAGWERPQWYDANLGLLESLAVTGESRTGWAAREWSPTVAAEHVATRERVALFDLTPFAKFEVTGPGALDALQRLASNQMDRPVGFDHLHVHAHAKRRNQVRPNGYAARPGAVPGGHRRSDGTPRPGLDSISSAGRPFGQRGRHLFGAMLYRPVGTEGARPAQPRLRRRPERRRDSRT